MPDLGAGAVVGANCKIQNNVSLYDAVVLEDDVFVGPSAVFTNVVNPRAFIERKREYRQTVVRHGATIGANATVVCGHEVGAYAFVAAGAVVTHDVAPHALVKGVPARPAGWVCRCGTVLVEEGDGLGCRDCQARYRLAAGGLEEVAAGRKP
jgi:UDP-2-acetamido-3-amino-2,3-dideoxy-glucuronate N-acetyltransferase